MLRYFLKYCSNYGRPNGTETHFTSLKKRQIRYCIVILFCIFKSYLNTYYHVLKLLKWLYLCSVIVVYLNLKQMNVVSNLKW